MNIPAFGTGQHEDYLRQQEERAEVARDLQGEQDHAEFTGWWEAQGYDADHAQTFYGADVMAETFLAGMQAARDLAAQDAQPAPGLAAAVAGAAMQKAVSARQDLEAARAAAAKTMNLVPLGRHASPDECEQIRRELRAIMTGLSS